MRLAWACCVACALLLALGRAQAQDPTPPKSAQPIPDAATRQAQRKQAAQLLQQGRKLSQARKYAEAVATLRRALALYPHDPAAQGELGYAALQAGQLDLAEASTLDALQTSRDPKQRASLLYNLGLIREQQGRTQDALQCWKDSLALRPHKAVQAKLDALPKDGATGWELWLNCALEGCGRGLRASTPAALCDELKRGLSCDTEVWPEAQTACEVLPAPPNSPPGFALVELSQTGCDTTDVWYTFFVLQDPRGWSVLDQVASYEDYPTSWVAGEGGQRVEAVELWWPDAKPVWALWLHTSSDHHDVTGTTQDGDERWSRFSTRSTSVLLYGPGTYYGELRTASSRSECPVDDPQEDCQGSEAEVSISHDAVGLIHVAPRTPDDLGEVARPGAYPLQELRKLTAHPKP